MKDKSLRSQKGQALIFVIATMTVAMAIGVGVAVRNISSISRSTRTDTATRAQAAAEGGVEDFLSKSDSELEGLIGSTQTVTFPPVAGDEVTTIAEVTVDHYNIPDGLTYLPVSVDENQVSQVLISGSGGVDVCWTSTDSESDTDLYLHAYSENAETGDDITNTGIRAGVVGDNNYESAASGTDFDHCYNDVPLPDSPDILRIRSIGGSSNVGVYPASGTLPAQGYEITSVGQLQSATEESDNVEARVVVRKSFSYLPGFFDFAIYSGQGL